MPLGDISDIDDFISGFQFSSGELRDAQDANAAKVGGSIKGRGTLGNILDDVSENVDVDTPGSVKVAEKFMQPVIAALSIFIFVSSIFLHSSNSFVLL